MANVRKFPVSHPEVLPDVVYVQRAAASQRRPVDRSPRTVAKTATLPWLETLFLIGCLMLLMIVRSLSAPDQFSAATPVQTGVATSSSMATAAP